MSNSVKIFLICMGIYLFIVFGVYFIMRIIQDDEDVSGDLFASIVWPIFVIVGVIYLPFYVLNKAAACVRQHIHRNEDDDERDQYYGFELLNTTIRYKCDFCRSCDDVELFRFPGGERRAVCKVCRKEIMEPTGIPVVYMGRNAEK